MRKFVALSEYKEYKSKGRKRLSKYNSKTKQKDKLNWQKY